MDKILESVRLRRLFFILYGLTICIAFLVRFFLVGSTSSAGLPREMFARILDGYISSSIVTLALGLVIYLGTSEIRQATDEIEILPAGDINRRFLKAHQTAKTWYFKGGLGRFFTSETLPNILKNGDSGYRFRAYLIDPFNLRLCNYVASHRGDSKTEKHIRAEALVTILEFVRRVHSQRTRVAEAFCGLIDDYAPLRIDLTDDGVFITHDNPSAPATFYRKESLFYSSYVQELTTGPNSYLVLDLVELVNGLSNSGISPPNTISNQYAAKIFEMVLTALQGERKDMDFSIAADEIAELVELAQHRKSPY